VVALDNGGALLHGFYAKHITPDGTKRNHVFVNNESPFALDGSADGSVWAFAGNEVRILKNVPAGIDYRISGSGSNMEPLPGGTYVGRYPRAIAVSDDGAYVAAGTTDGTFSLLDSDGNILWQQRDGASYVTQIEFLANGEGVAFSREIFDYQHDNNPDRNGWRFRDVVEAYDLAGNPLWRHEGGWRESEPFMNRFALSADNTRLALLTRETVRYVDLTGPAVDNAQLYAVEDSVGGGDSPPVGPGGPTSVQVSGPGLALPGQEYTFSASVNPISVATPVTFTWEVEGQPPVSGPGNGPGDTQTFSWESAGDQLITVTAESAGREVSTTYRVAVRNAEDLRTVALPVMRR
jgi:hypothetical protein